MRCIGGAGRFRAQTQVVFATPASIGVDPAKFFVVEELLAFLIGASPQRFIRFQFRIPF